MKNMQKKDYINNFTYNVTQLRKGNNLSKKQMTKILGISLYSLNMIEKGVLPPKLKVNIFFKITHYFDIPIKDLLEKKMDIYL